jgi:hypothetical protein
MDLEEELMSSSLGPTRTERKSGLVLALKPTTILTKFLKLLEKTSNDSKIELFNNINKKHSHDETFLNSRKASENYLFDLCFISFIFTLFFKNKEKYPVCFV